MNADISAFVQYLVTGVVVILAISMICTAAGQKLIAAQAVRRATVRRQQRVSAENRTPTWGGNSLTFRR